uniref:Zinc finger, CCHC-type n=1 Tax=Tanacetum cinerariifolium TaxID=118510 RepID=A0A6L2JMG9_TANCI|nr:zinc finger, CCHC-type [Tanacetum cinerariifolium]
MGDANPTRTLGDYSKPSHEGYMNTIELPIGNNVVPLRFDTIRLVQNEYSFHELWPEDPNQHLKYFLKLVDSLDLDGENKERKHLYPQCSSHLSTLINAIKTYSTETNISQTSQLQTGMGIGTQQPDGHKPTIEDEFQDLHLNLPVLEVLAHAPIYKEIFDKYVETIELGKNGSAFIQGEVSAKMEAPGLFTQPCRLGYSKPFDILSDLGSCVNIIPLYLFKKLNIGLLEKTDHIFGESYKPHPSLDGVGIQIPYYTRKDFLDFDLPREWEIARDVEINPFKDVLVFRKMVEFLGAIPINLKSNILDLTLD